jgi:hypothetical protein
LLVGDVPQAETTKARQVIVARRLYCILWSIHFPFLGGCCQPANIIHRKESARCAGASHNLSGRLAFMEHS